MTDDPSPKDALAVAEAAVGSLCHISALFGGVVLAALMIVVVVSVVGRSAFNAPILGDFELVQSGAVMAVFAFLPDCEWKKANVIVDLFTTRTPIAWRRRLDAMSSAILCLIALILTWRMSLGAAEMYRYGEVGAVLGLSVWWNFVPVVPACLLLAVAAGLNVARHLKGRLG